MDRVHLLYAALVWNLTVSASVAVRIAWLAPGPDSRSAINSETSVSAVKLALKSLSRTSSHTDMKNIGIKYFETGCDAKSAMVAMQQQGSYKPDVIIGPPCHDAMAAVARLASFWNLPVFGWYNPSTEFNDVTKYPTLVRLMPSVSILSKTLIHILRQKNWHKFTLIHEDDDVGIHIKDSVKDETSKETDVNILNTLHISENMTQWQLQRVLNSIKMKGKVIALACSRKTVRRLLVIAARVRMAEGNYIFIHLDYQIYSTAGLRGVLSDRSWRLDDDDDEAAARAYDHLIHIVLDPTYDRNPHVTRVIPMSQYGEFSSLAASESGYTQPNWYLPTPSNGSLPDVYSMYLYDSVLVWSVLREVLTQTGKNPKDGHLMARIAKNFDSDGTTGYVAFNNNLDRLGKALVLDMNNRGKFKPVKILKYLKKGQVEITDMVDSVDMFSLNSKTSSSIRPTTTTTVKPTTSTTTTPIPTTTSTTTPKPTTSSTATQKLTTTSTTTPKSTTSTTTTPKPTTTTTTTPKPTYFTTTTRRLNTAKTPSTNFKERTGTSRLRSSNRRSKSRRRNNRNYRRFSTPKKKVTATKQLSKDRHLKKTDPEDNAIILDQGLAKLSDFQSMLASVIKTKQPPRNTQQEEDTEIHKTRHRLTFEGTKATPPTTQPYDGKSNKMTLTKDKRMEANNKRTKRPNRPYLQPRDLRPQKKTRTPQLHQDVTGAFDLTQTTKAPISHAERLANAVNELNRLGAGNIDESSIHSENAFSNTDSRVANAVRELKRLSGGNTGRSLNHKKDIHESTIVSSDLHEMRPLNSSFRENSIFQDKRHTTFVENVQNADHRLDLASAVGSFSNIGDRPINNDHKIANAVQELKRISSGQLTDPPITKENLNGNNQMRLRNDFRTKQRMDSNVLPRGNISNTNIANSYTDVTDFFRIRNNKINNSLPPRDEPKIANAKVLENEYLSADAVPSFKRNFHSEAFGSSVNGLDNSRHRIDIKSPIDSPINQLPDTRSESVPMAYGQSLFPTDILGAPSLPTLAEYRSDNDKTFMMQYDMNQMPETGLIKPFRSYRDNVPQRKARVGRYIVNGKSIRATRIPIQQYATTKPMNKQEISKENMYLTASPTRPRITQFLSAPSTKSITPQTTTETTTTTSKATPTTTTTTVTPTTTTRSTTTPTTIPISTTPSTPNPFDVLMERVMMLESLIKKSASTTTSTTLKPTSVKPTTTALKLTTTHIPTTNTVNPTTTSTPTTGTSESTTITSMETTSILRSNPMTPKQSKAQSFRKDYVASKSLQDKLKPIRDILARLLAVESTIAGKRNQKELQLRIEKVRKRLAMTIQNHISSKQKPNIHKTLNNAYSKTATIDKGILWGSSVRRLRGNIKTHLEEDTSDRVIQPIINTNTRVMSPEIKQPHTKRVDRPRVLVNGTQKTIQAALDQSLNNRQVDASNYNPINSKPRIRSRNRPILENPMVNKGIVHSKNSQSTSLNEKNDTKLVIEKLSSKVVERVTDQLARKIAEATIENQNGSQYAIHIVSDWIPPKSEEGLPKLKMSFHVNKTDSQNSTGKLKGNSLSTNNTHQEPPYNVSSITGPSTHRNVSNTHVEEDDSKLKLKPSANSPPLKTKGAGLKVSFATLFGMKRPKSMPPSGGMPPMQPMLPMQGMPPGGGMHSLPRGGGMPRMPPGRGMPMMPPGGGMPHMRGMPPMMGSPYGMGPPEGGGEAEDAPPQRQGYGPPSHMYGGPPMQGRPPPPMYGRPPSSMYRPPGPGGPPMYGPPPGSRPPSHHPPWQRQGGQYPPYRMPPHMGHGPPMWGGGPRRRSRVVD